MPGAGPNVRWLCRCPGPLVRGISATDTHSPPGCVAAPRQQHRAFSRAGKSTSFTGTADRFLRLKRSRSMLPDEYRWIVDEFEPEGNPRQLLAIAIRLEEAGNLEGAATVYDRAWGLD